MIRIKFLLSNYFGWVRPFQYNRHGNILIEDYRAIYFFIPKVACSSLKLAISDLINITPPDPVNKSAYPHKRSYPYVKRNIILKHYSSYFRFAFVRNPWDRLLSCYQNKIVGVRNGKFGEVILPEFFNNYPGFFSLDMSFQQFVAAINAIPDKYADPHFRSQYTFLEDNQGNDLANYIGRFENLNDDFDAIKKRLNAPLFTLPHIMQSPRENRYREYYDQRTIRLVQTRYEKDIYKYMYKF